MVFRCLVLCQALECMQFHALVLLIFFFFVGNKKEADHLRFISPSSVSREFLYKQAPELSEEPMPSNSNEIYCSPLTNASSLSAK